VALNKVVTAQYFVWYLSLLPLVLPALAAQRAVSWGARGAGGAAWVAAQLHWLAWAYQLEMRVRSPRVS
jgi:phosphatidylinositol glycan class M